MIFKLIGGLFVVAASSGLGFQKAMEYKKRVKELNDLQAAATQLETEIRFTQAPLAQAFAVVSKTTGGTIGEIFEEASKRLDVQTGATAANAWREAVENTRTRLSLTKADLETAISFGTALGGSDVEGQLKHIAATREKLQVQLTEARESCKKNQKLFTNLGVYAGILIAVLLF